MADCLTLKKSNCKNCYKCIRNCPVKSIRFSGNQARIISNECILCGQCFVVCPQNAKQIVDDTEKVKVLIESGDPVYVSLAPSFVANYEGVGIEGMRKALKQLGFFNVEETAIGATIVKNEYQKMLQDGKHNILISSCCHSVNLLIQKYFPEVLPYLADVQSPMLAHAADIKRRDPKAKIVFIGPCVSKKDEAAMNPELVDAALTYEELSRWMAKEQIKPEKGLPEAEGGKARFFPTTGGILKTMDLSDTNYSYLAVDGSDNCISVLKDIQNGGINNCFIEMSICSGSCVGGPVMEKYHSSPVKSYVEVSKYAGTRDFKVEDLDSADVRHSFTPISRNVRMPYESEIRDILRSMGKNKPEDELNCGSCGYNTCREKAIAIYQGKADSSMCLPFLKEKAESFSDAITNNSPNGIVVVNENFEVQQINQAAMKMLHLRNASYILGDQVVRLMDPDLFMQVQRTGRDVIAERTYLAEYDLHVEQTVVQDRESKLLICIMRDVTQEAIDRERKESISQNTIEIADRVVEKQMRIVQEIASLLGETAAETKIALTKLKESVNNE